MIESGGTFAAAYIIVSVIIVGYVISLARRAAKYRRRLDGRDE